MRDRLRPEQARRELVDQRLEGVVVVPVDEDDVGVGLLQRARGADARRSRRRGRARDGARSAMARRSRGATGRASSGRDERSGPRVDAPGARVRSRRARAARATRRSGTRSAGTSSARRRGCRRATSGSGSPVKSMQVRVRGVDPERHARAAVGMPELDAREPVVAALELGEGSGRAASRRSAARRRKSSSVPSTGAEPTGMAYSSDVSTVRRGRAEHRRVDRPVPDREVRVRAGAVRARLGADVRRARPHREARRRRARTRPAARARTGSRAADGARARARPGAAPRSTAVQGDQRTRPWIAFWSFGSVSARWWRPAEPARSGRGGCGSATGTSSCPRPDLHGSLGRRSRRARSRPPAA